MRKFAIEVAIDEPATDAVDGSSSTSVVACPTIHRRSKREADCYIAVEQWLHLLDSVT